jgi:predicted small metal-binding protein
MTKVLKCGDLNPGCNFEIHGHSENEVLKQAVAHAKTAHHMKDVPPDVLSKARSAIHDEGEVRAQRSAAI